MKKWIYLSLVLPSIIAPFYQANADTIGRYAEIIKSIPEATLKADPKSQAWAHSARTILAVAEESITETIVSMHTLTTQKNMPLFCLPQGQNITSDLIHKVLEQSATNLSKNEAQKNLSEVVIEKLTTNYPCRGNQFQSAQNELFAPKNYQMQSVTR